MSRTGARGHRGGGRGGPELGLGSRGGLPVTLGGGGGCHSPRRVPPRQLVAAGLLTVRDAGSWWLAVPGVGRFVRALLRGECGLPTPGTPPGPRWGLRAPLPPGAPPVTAPVSAGRRALLALVRRSRHREVPLRDLQSGKAPPGARLGVPFLLHDLLGAQQLQRYRPGTAGAP